LLAKGWVSSAATSGEISSVTAPWGTLKIVVIEGEDAVNVAQQTSAIAPVVEVRDRNNQPVAGAVVRFAVTRGRAGFNGARVLTVTTNQAGRAVGTGVTPTGAGAIQISATATFQGETAAITIAQTNVLTAAAGAQAGAASAGGAGTTAGTAAGAGAGGGLSATTIGVVAGAAAGGAIAVKEVTASSAAARATPVTYAGTYSGLVTFTASEAGINCGFIFNAVGTMTMNLAIESDTPDVGTGEVHETDTLGQSTCSGASAGGFNSLGLQVRGSAANLTIQRQQTFETGATLMLNVQGVLNGGVITGTLSLGWSGQSRNSVATGTASFPVVLAQQ
jgi:hypothetical protein